MGQPWIVKHLLRRAAGRPVILSSSGVFTAAAPSTTPGLAAEFFPFPREMPRGPAPPSGADLKELINFAEVDSLLGIQFVNVTDVSIHQVETKTHYLEQEGDRAQKPITTTGKVLKKTKLKKEVCAHTHACPVGTPIPKPTGLQFKKGDINLVSSKNLISVKEFRLLLQ